MVQSALKPQTGAGGHAGAPDAAQGRTHLSQLPDPTHAQALTSPVPPQRCPSCPGGLLWLVRLGPFTPVAAARRVRPTAPGHPWGWRPQPGWICSGSCGRRGNWSWWCWSRCPCFLCRSSTPQAWVHAHAHAPSDLHHNQSKTWRRIYGDWELNVLLYKHQQVEFRIDSRRLFKSIDGNCSPVFSFTQVLDYFYNICLLFISPDPGKRKYSWTTKVQLNSSIPKHFSAWGDSNQ